MVDSVLLGIIACPRDNGHLRFLEGRLCCGCGSTYPVVDGIPILLRDDVEQTHFQAQRSLDVAHGRVKPPAHEERLPGDLGAAEIDPVVQAGVAGTNGIMYTALIGNLKQYPIPDIDLPAGQGRVFIEIGSNWGRWCIAAARKGYMVIGVDPSLRALRAAARVAAQLGLRAHFVVGDGRFLPIRTGAADVVYSYSVLQHLSKHDATLSLQHAARVLRDGGTALVQMPNAFGLRSLYHQLRRGFREARQFEVRYWTPGELRDRFERTIGPAEVTIDGFFSLNPQVADRHLLPTRFRAVVTVSDTLRTLGGKFTPLRYVADSLTIRARKRSGGSPAQLSGTAS